MKIGNGGLRTLDERPEAERKAIAHKGANASVQARKKQREIRNGTMTMQTLVCNFMGRKTADAKTKQELISFGYVEDECININAFISRLFSLTMKGNMRAAELLVTLGGLTGEEVRKNAEEERKARESEARIKMMVASAGKEMSLSSTGEEGSVVIYLPEIEKDRLDN